MQTLRSLGVEEVSGYMAALDLACGGAWQTRCNKDFGRNLEGSKLGLQELDHIVLCNCATLLGCVEHVHESEQQRRVSDTSQVLPVARTRTR
jgi:hypothetical protein